MLTLLNKIKAFNLNKGKKGSAMLLVIMTMGVILVIGTSMLFVTLSSFSRSVADTNQQRAQEAAFTVAENLKENVASILPLYSAQIKKDVTADKPVNLKFNGATEVDGKSVVSINGANVYVDIYKDKSTLATDNVMVKVVAKFRSQFKEIKFVAKGEVTASYDYIEDVFGNSFVMTNNLGSSTNDYALVIKRVEGDVSIDVNQNPGDNNTKALNAKITEGITGSVFADGNLIIGSEWNVIPIQGNIYVNGDLTLRGVDLGKVLPTLYETRFGNVEYWNRAGQKREKGKGEPGEAMFFAYRYDGQPVETKYHVALACQVADINNKNVADDMDNKNKGQFGDIAPMQLYTEDSRPVISIKVDGKDTQIEGYYNENGILRKLNSEVESEKPVIGEFMYKSPTEKFIGGCPNYVPRYVVGGNIYCSGNLIIDKANQGFITYEQVIKDPATATYNYVESCARPYILVGGGKLCQRPIPNQSAIRGDIFVQGKMIYAPDNLGVNNTENGKDWSDKTLKKMDYNSYFSSILGKVRNEAVKNGFIEGKRLFNKTLTWNRWEIYKNNDGHYAKGTIWEVVNSVKTRERTFRAEFKNEIEKAAKILYELYGETYNPTADANDSKKISDKIANDFMSLAIKGGAIDKPLMTRVPSMIDGNQKNIYTQMIISENTDIYINNQKKSNGGYVPYGNSSSTLFYSTLNAHGRTIEAAKGDKDSSNGLEKNFAVEGYTAALTVKFHDKFNCSSIYANGEIATVSSNLNDCKIITNLGKEGATVRGTNLVTSQYDMWNFMKHFSAENRSEEEYVGVLNSFFNKIAQVDLNFIIKDTCNGSEGYMDGSSMKYVNADLYGTFSTEVKKPFNIFDKVFGGRGEGEAGSYDGNIINDSWNRSWFNKEDGSLNIIKRGYDSKKGFEDGVYGLYDAFNAINSVALFSSNANYGININTAQGNALAGYDTARHHFSGVSSNDIVAKFIDTAFFRSKNDNKDYAMYLKGKKSKFASKITEVTCVNDIFTEMANEKFAEVFAKDPKEYVAGNNGGGENSTQISMNQLIAEGKVTEYTEVKSEQKTKQVKAYDTNKVANPIMIASDKTDKCLGYSDTINEAIWTMTFTGVAPSGATNKLTASRMSVDPMSEQNMWTAAGAVFAGEDSTQIQSQIEYDIDKNIYFNFPAGNLYFSSSQNVAEIEKETNLATVTRTRRVVLNLDTSKQDIFVYFNTPEVVFLKTTIQVTGKNNAYLILVDDTCMSGKTYKLAVDNTSDDKTDARLGTHFLSGNVDEYSYKFMYGGGIGANQKVEHTKIASHSVGNLFIVGASEKNTLSIGRGGLVNGFVYLPNGTYTNISRGILGILPTASSQNNKASIVAKKIELEGSNSGKLIFSALDPDATGTGGASVVFNPDSSNSTTIEGSEKWSFVGYVFD